MTLNYLLGKQLSKVEFFDDFFETAPLHVKGSCFGLYTIKKFEELLWRSEHLLHEKLRINAGGNPVIVPYLKLGIELTEWAFEQFHAGRTVIFNGMGDVCPELSRFSKGFRTDFSSNASVNGFLTPPKSQGFLEHFDTHDVFLCQIAGSKRWVVREPEIRLPVPRQQRALDTTDLTDVVLDVILNEGDVLYIPRGFVHAGASVDEASLHLTIGARPETGASRIAALVNELALDHECLRRAYSDDSSDEIIQTVIDHLKSVNLAKRVQDRMIVKGIGEGRSNVSGRFSWPVPVEAIRLTTRLQKVSDYDFQLVEFEGQLALVHAVGKTRDFRDELNPAALVFPPTMFGLLKEIERSDGAFSAKSLNSGSYCDNEILEILQKLTRHGLLQFSDKNS